MVVAKYRKSVQQALSTVEGQRHIPRTLDAVAHEEDSPYT